MRTLVLGPNRGRLAPILGDAVVGSAEDRIDAELCRKMHVELIVSFGYRHILGPEVLAAVNGNAVNLHMSKLPWNRGADPNLWSWLENSPKGVSIHWMTTGLDRGDLIASAEAEVCPSHTLRTSYGVLQELMVALFEETWPSIKRGNATQLEQGPGGSYHRSADKERHRAAMPRGWDTACQDVAEYGRKAGLWITHGEVPQG